MANSGSFNTSKIAGTNIYIKLDWSITNINNDAGTGTLNWNAYVVNENGATTAYIVYGNNWLGVNDSLKWQLTGSGNGSYNNPYPMYNGAYDSDKFYATRQYYTFEGWAYRIRNINSGSITIYYNEEGLTSIKFNGEFKCNGSSDYYKVSLDTGYFQPDRIERFNKAQRSNNQGNNWNKDVYFWKTTNYGATWTKCKGYKTTNSGNNWNKV